MKNFISTPSFYNLVFARFSISFHFCGERLVKVVLFLNKTFNNFIIIIFILYLFFIINKLKMKTNNNAANTNN